MTKFENPYNLHLNNAREDQLEKGSGERASETLVTGFEKQIKELEQEMYNAEQDARFDPDPRKAQDRFIAAKKKLQEIKALQREDSQRIARADLRK